MKILISLMALLMASTGLIFTGKSAPLSGKAVQTALPVSINEIMRAHNAPQTPDALSAVVADAVKVNYFPVDPGSELPGFFELKVSVAINGSAFRRHRFDPHGSWELYDLFDGQDAYRSEIRDGTTVGPASRMDDLQYRASRFGVMTFGLVPIIRQLQDPRAEIVYLEPAPGRQDKFSVKIGSDSWTLYSDQRHLITRVEMGNKTIQYADFRPVGNVRLPFIQRLSVGGELIYELFFTRIDINPSFPPNSFKRESLPNEGGR